MSLQFGHTLVESKFKTLQIETLKGNRGATQVYISYLLPEEDAVSLAMTYDRKLGKLIYRGFKATLEVVESRRSGNPRSDIMKAIADRQRIMDEAVARGSAMRQSFE